MNKRMNGSIMGPYVNTLVWMNHGDQGPLTVLMALLFPTVCVSVVILIRKRVAAICMRFLSNYSPKSSFDHLIATGYRFLVNHVTGNRRVHLFDRSSTVLRYSILYAAPNLRWVFRKENTVGNYHCYITLQATIRNLRLSPIHLQLPLLRALLLWDFLKKVKNKPRWNT